MRSRPVSRLVGGWPMIGVQSPSAPVEPAVPRRVHAGRVRAANVPLVRRATYRQVRSCLHRGRETCRDRPRLRGTFIDFGSAPLPTPTPPCFS
jgi:hypothetical protein